jgi:hypothetical protein
VAGAYPVVVGAASGVVQDLVGARDIVEASRLAVLGRRRVGMEPPGEPTERVRDLLVARLRSHPENRIPVRGNVRRIRHRITPLAHCTRRQDRSVSRLSIDPGRGIFLRRQEEAEDVDAHAL